MMLKIQNLIANFKFAITQHPNPSLMLLFSLLGSTTFFILGYMTYSKLPQSFPLISNGIISNFTLEMASVISSYLLFGVLFLLTLTGSIVGIWLSAKNTVSSNRFFREMTNVAIYGMLATILISLILKITFKDPGLVMTDYFHDGERLAFLGMSSGFEDLFSSSVFIHGLSNNIIPIALAEIFFPDNTIAGFRIIIICQHFLSYLALYLLMLSVLKTMDLKFNIPLFSLFLLGVITLVGGPLLYVGPKDLFLLYMLAAIFGFIANYDSRFGFFCGLLAGVLVVLSLLYTFNRALYGMAFFLIMSGVFIGFGRKIYKTWFFSAGLGVLLGCLMIISLFGSNVLEDLAFTYFYWIENAKLIWGRIPPLITSPEILMAWLITLLLMIFGATSIIVLFALTSDGRLKNYNSKYKLTLIGLFIFAPIFVRDFVDRFYFGKVTDSAFPILLLAMMILASQFRYLQVSSKNLQLMSYLKFGFIFFLSSALATQSAVILSKYNSALNLNNDMLIESDYEKALEELLVLTADQDCFYTMTSEGAWYYFLDKPSCSNFPIVTYARSNKSQNNVIDDLKNKSPKFILFSNRGWSNNIDNVSVFSANNLVMRYLLSNYEPYSLIESHWIWKLRDKPYEFQSALHRSLLSQPNSTRVFKNQDFNLSGELDDALEFDAVVFSLVDGLPAWVGIIKANQKSWIATVPSGAMINGTIMNDSRRIDVGYIKNDGDLVVLKSEIIKARPND